MNLIYVLDGDTPEQNRRDWFDLIGEESTDVAWNGSQLISCANNNALASDVSGLVLIHTSYCPASALPLLSTMYPTLILIALNAGGIPSGPRGPMYWSLATPVGKRPTDAAFGARLRTFVNGLKSGSVPSYITLEPDCESIPALCLLCDAWLLNRDKAATGGVKETQFHGGILVRAPVSPDHWFSPFIAGYADKGTPEREINQKAKGAAAEKASAGIAAQMRGAEAEVASFLQALTRLYAINDKPAVTCIEFEQAITTISSKLTLTTPDGRALSK